MDSSDPRLRYLDGPDQVESMESHLTSVEQKFLNGLLRGSGYTLVLSSQPSFSNDSFREIFKVGAQNSSGEGRSKRMTQHNQLFKEEPWTMSILKLVQTVSEKDFRSDIVDHRKKFRENSKYMPLGSLFRDQLEIVKKKLMRGDYIGMAHFEADMAKIWTEARQKEKSGTLLYKASIQLELAYNEGWASQQDYEAEAKKVALSKCKTSLRRKKSNIRKGSDHIESKATADQEPPNTITSFENTLFQTELEEKLPKLKSKDLAGLRKILKRLGCQSSSSTLAIDRKLEVQRLREPALKAVLAYIRRKVDRKARRPTQAKSKCQKPVKGAMIIEENCNTSSNSSFLTGKIILNSDSDRE
jgi:hypothetical protein